MHTAQAQEQPEAAHALHHPAAAGARAQVQAEAVLVHSGARRVLLVAGPHRGPGEDLVPESARQGQAPAGGRAREVQAGRQAALLRQRARLLQSPAGGLSVRRGQLGHRQRGTGSGFWRRRLVRHRKRGRARRERGERIRGRGRGPGRRIQ